MDNTQEIANAPAVEIVEQKATLTPVASAYVDTLVQPYVDALTAATTIESIAEWLPAVVPEKAADIVPYVTAFTDVEAAKTFSVNWIKNLLIEYTAEKEGVPVDQLTPWDLAANRDEMLTRLFGEASTQLPIVVVIGPNAFVHSLTEELAYGLVIGLNDNPEFGIFSNITPLKADVFDLKYQDNDGKYSANINGKQYRFATSDLIQGVATAAEWTKRKPHDLVTDLLEGDTPINF